MFHLTFLGTGAADFSPKLADEFRGRFTKEARRSTSALLDDHVLIDCGPHTWESMEIAGISPDAVSDLVFTHLHGDHFNEENVRRLAAAKSAPLHIWVRGSADFPEIAGTIVHKMELYSEYDLGGGLTLTPVDANHDQNVHPEHLLFARDGEKMLYALDGAWFINKAYNFLKNASLSLLVIDATCGDYEGDFRMAEHNSIPMLRLMMPSLIKVKMITPETKIVLSHLARTLHKSHEETVEIVRNDGYIVAYDGMELDV